MDMYWLLMTFTCVFTHLRCSSGSPRSRCHRRCRARTPGVRCKPLRICGRHTTSCLPRPCSRGDTRRSPCTTNADRSRCQSSGCKLRQSSPLFNTVKNTSMKVPPTHRTICCINAFAVSKHLSIILCILNTGLIGCFAILLFVLFERYLHEQSFRGQLIHVRYVRVHECHEYSACLGKCYRSTRSITDWRVG